MRPVAPVVTVYGYRTFVECVYHLRSPGLHPGDRDDSHCRRMGRSRCERAAHTLKHKSTDYEDCFKAE